MQILISRAHYPHFANNDASLLDAGSATACLIVREKWPDQPKRRYATAFFVTRTLLLTAGHNVRPSDGALEIIDIRITYAGWKEVTTMANTLECSLVANLYKGGPREWQRSTTDIAVLDCQGHTAESHMKLSINVVALEPGVFVDVVGYPQQMKQEQKDSLTDRKGVTETKLEDAGKMLPACTLTATRGQITSREDGVFVYNNSTVPGMSGACVLFDGHVYGTSDISSIGLILQASISDSSAISIMPSLLSLLRSANSFKNTSLRRILRRKISWKFNWRPERKL
jgi:V8-like Glu-specific endopeptidase